MVLAVIYFIFKIFYPVIKRHQTPKGKRIKHRMLKGYLRQKYGKDDGKSIYKKMVDSMRKRGYY
jgi:hypothetical protein